MAGRYWREASTLILVGRNNPFKKISNEGWKEVHYRLLFLKRSSKSSFMPSSYVFPGGALDEGDLNTNWLSLFKQHGYFEEDLLKKLRYPGNQLEMYQNKTANDLLPELAFRICALRETFEETGLLLTSKIKNGNSVSSIFPLEGRELKEWRSKIHNNGSEFINLMKHINEVPSVLSLYEWISWLTPTTFKGLRRRFDTVFYVTFIDSEVPVLAHDEHEADELKVASPPLILKAFHDKQVIMAPPQIYELLRICNFSRFDAFKKFTEERSRKGIARWMPEFVQAKDGNLSILPGDDLYPESPDYFGLKDTKTTFDQTMEELERASTHLHRIELNKLSEANLIVKNVEQEFGHLNPVTFAQLRE